MFFIVGKSSSKNVYRTVEQVLRSHYSKLTASTQTCLSIIASELYSKNLINKEVRHSPTFEKIEIDFSAMVSLYTEDTTKMMEVCSLFIDCLLVAGGPVKEEAIALARDWENEVFKDHQVLFSFAKAATELIPKEVQLGFNDRLAIELRNLHKKYAKLMTDITTYYASSGKHDPIVIARWGENYFSDITDLDLAWDGVTVDKIFKQMRPYHSFIDIDVISDLMKDFPMDDSALQARFDEYADSIENFITSAELNNIITAIESAIIGENTKVDPKIILKLSGRWNEQTVSHVRKLVDYLFNEKAKFVTIKKFLRGSICIQFFVFSNRSVQLLIVKSQAKIPFLHLLGIFQLIIDNQTIIDRKEDISFTFEESLLQSIASIDSSLEYQRLFVLLIELKIKLNYRNSTGQTALMLASKGGHIEIFKSLLQNGANPFVQLSTNKGYIGLNRLACTALSQHIYKSIGGERIIPRDDTSVEDMLEIAVKERGVSGQFYEPFMHVVENKITEKFQWLQDCFHALDSSFLDAATNILTSKALVTEAKQNFQSYIKEDATCEDAHQLVQLLQPHYSCLNINLLTIPCTITEPIKEQVEEYNTNLKIFKDTTSLLELTMMTKGMPCPVGVGCSKLILKLNKPWCSRAIAELNKIEIFYFLPTLSFLNLIETHYDASSYTCTYFLSPLSQTEALIAAVFEQRVSLYKIGVFEVMIDDIPIVMEDEDTSFTFEAALQNAHQTNNENVLFFLLELNISLPLDDTDLMIAINRRDFVTVQFLLSKDPDINFQNNNGWTALMFASRNGHHQVVELLLSKDPDINIQNNDGVTALMTASGNGHHQVVELLLSKDPDINIQNNDGWTVLMDTSSNGHHQVVELLLSKNPNINIQNNYDWTALMYASHNGHHQVVELLLSKDSNINIQNNYDWTALMLASRNGHHQVVELLLSKDPNINIQSNNGWTALMLASHNGYHQVVELLLSKDPDINIQDNDGWTVLIVASCYGHYQVVELLLSKDPDINIQDNDGWTALMPASSNGHHQVVELLLSKDPDINIQNNDGLTALMLASCNGHHQVVELLLSKDPDINIQNNGGLTALMLASHNGHYQVVELLLSKDPDINIQDNDGWTALIRACGCGHHQVVELLLSKDPDVNIQNNDGWTALFITLFFSIWFIDNLVADDTLLDEHTQLPDSLHSGNYIEILELLLYSHPNHVHNFDGEKLHSLAVAALSNNFGAISVLMKKCDITPEHIISASTMACYAGHSLMIIHLSEKITLSTNVRKFLVAAAEGDLGTLINMIYEVGMSPDTPLAAGMTPLMIAASCGHIELVEALIQAGADVNKRNDEGLNALDIVNDSMFYDRSDIKELLISNTPAVEPDPASNNAESTNKKPSTVATIKSIFGMFNSFMKKAYDPYYSKQKELKIPHGMVTDTPNSAMTSNNMPQFVS